jgi:hypothetical protein
LLSSAKVSTLGISVSPAVVAGSQPPVPDPNTVPCAVYAVHRIGFTLAPLLTAKAKNFCHRMPRQDSVVREQHLKMIDILSHGAGGVLHAAA